MNKQTWSEREVGPRVVGGTYRDGYWNETYTVEAIKAPDDRSGWAMRVRWSDGRATIHSTAWDAERDSVVATATVPERAPVGMLAVRVGSDPWTMIPLDDEQDTSAEGANDMATTRRTDAEILDGLWEITLDGFHDAECGNVDENGYWYGLIRFSTEADKLGLPGMAGAIVETDSYGFKGYNAYETTTALDAAWANCAASATGEDIEDSYYS